MTTQRDPNAIIAAWLDEGPVDLPGTTRRAIATSLPTTTQRRGLGLPRRLPRMSTSLRLLLMVGALALAVGGIYLFSGVGGPPVTPAPSDAPASVPAALGATPTAATPSLAPSSSPTAADLGLTGRLVFNRYNTEASMYGDPLGMYISNADGTNERAISLPDGSDGAVFSPDGTRLLLAGTAGNGKYRGAIINVDGGGYHRLDTPGSFGGMSCLAWAPDGQRVLCSVDSGQKGIDGGVYSIRASDGGGLTQLNNGAPGSVEGTASGCGGGDFVGDVSPDGSRYVFYRNWCGEKPDPVATENAGLWTGDMTGRTKPVEVLKAPSVNPHEAPPRWSPDGNWIVFGTDTQTLAVVRPNGKDYATIPLHVGDTDSYAYSPDWSPDGNWIVFSLWLSRESRSELYVVHRDGSDLTRVTTATGTEDLVSWGVAAP